MVVDNKICKECKVLKPSDEFYKCKTVKSGLEPKCKKCRCASRDKEKIKELGKKYRENNKEKVKETNRNYRENNKEKIREYGREYSIKYYHDNKKQINSKALSRYHTDIKHKIKHNLRGRINSAVKKTKKSNTTMNLIGCTIDELKNHLEAKFDDKMTWDNYGSYWEIDHILPCASFNLLDPEEQKLCFHYTNLQPLEAGENRRKNAKIDWNHENL